MAKKSSKNHLICMKCGAQSTGKSIKECNKTFPICGVPGIGPITDSCKLNMLQDGQPIVKLLEIADYEKLIKVSQKAQEAKAKTETVNKAATPPKEESTPKETKKATKNSN